MNKTMIAEPESSRELREFQQHSARAGGGAVRIRKAGKRYVILVNGGRLGVDSLEEVVDNVEQLRQAALKLQTTEEELSDAIFGYLDAEDARRRSKRLPFWTNGQTFEAVELEDGSQAFLTHDGSSYSLAEKVEAGGGLSVVPESLAKDPYRFTREKVAKAAVPELGVLYVRVLAVVEDYFAHLDSRVHKLLAMMIVHSYVLTRSNGTAFLWLVGPKRSGKSTFETVVERLGYRVFAGTDPTPSTIYRTLGDEVEYAPTVVIREYGWANEVMRQIAREGDVPGSTKPVTEQLPNGRYVVVHYWLYGWRVVASNNLHGVDADLDRYFVLRCMRLPTRRPRSELHRDREVMAALEALRKDLLLWKVANLDSLKFPYDDPKGEIRDRDWEHFGGVLTLAKAVGAELEAELRGYIREYIKEKEEDDSGGAYSVLLGAVQELATEANRLGNGYRIAFKDIWSLVERRTTEGSDKNGKPVRVTPGGETLTTTKAGRLLNQQLAGKPSKWGGTTRGYVWPEEVMKMLGASAGTGWTSRTGSTVQAGIKQTELAEHEASGIDGGELNSRALQPVQPVQPVLSASQAKKTPQHLQPPPAGTAMLFVCSCGGGPYRSPNDKVWKGHKRLMKDEPGHELREAKNFP